MNKFPKISIIVPVFNAEKYIIQCIDSILTQDFTDFELLLIDDGSKDKSGFICDEYTRNDKRVKVFHKKNEGVSSARNLGIDKAQGEYITFIDSDDYVDANYLTILMSEKEADLVVTGYVNTYFTKSNYSPKNLLYTKQEIPYCLTSQLGQQPFRVPWIKRFKLDILKKHAIYFNTTLHFGEDTIFVQTYLMHCNSIAFREGTPYHYRVEQNKEYFFRHNLSAEEYICTLNIASETYNKLTEHFGFTCPDYYRDTNKFIIIQYFNGIIQTKFTLKGYSNYKQTTKRMLPETIFSNRLYAIVYKFLQKKQYFLSFLILKFIFPLRIYFKK